MISIISAIGNNNEIGKKNDLLWSLPADMKHFRETTRGHTVIMGKKTFESLATDENSKQIGRLLPNRRNIILTLDTTFKRDGAEVVNSIEELIKLLRTSPQPSPEKGEGVNSEEEVFIIGGGAIYKLFIDKADKLYITHVKESFPEAEIFFPKIDPNKWEKIKSETYQKDELNQYNLEFAEYIKK